MEASPDLRFITSFTYDDKPLGGATIQFAPLDTRGQPAVGVSNSHGVFHLSTFMPDDGALPGDYKVTVRKEKGDQASDTVTAPANKMEAFNLYVKKAKEIVKEQYNAKAWTLIPLIYADGEKTPLRCQVPPPDGKVTLPLRSTE